VRLATALLAALTLSLSASAAAPEPGWTTYGDGTARAGDAPDAAPTSLTRDFVLPVDGRVVGQTLEDGGLFYTATTAGEVVAFTADGYVRWRADVGQFAQSCAQLDGYGILGTGVIDDGSGTLYVADAFGRLHAFDLATGAEKTGWPIRVVSDFRRQLIWGALTLADGAVYVPTASYCDSPSMGGVYRVDVASQQVSTWFSVPQSEGGGGGVWGWGGTAYSADDDALYAVTANAFAGGPNTGDDFSESVGYGEHLVKLAPDLTVEDASHPDDLDTPGDLDFVGSPVVFDRPGCGELVVGADKNDVVYAWRADSIGDGPIWELGLQNFDAADPLLSQLAWSPSLSSLYAVTGTQLVRIAIAAGCNAHVDWAEPLGTHTENGNPTIAGDTVWFAVNGTPRLVGYDARTGDRIFETPLGGTTVEAPMISDGRLVVGTMSGLVEGFSFGDAADPPASVATTSWATKRLGWQSRSDGVYATEDAGNSWHKIFAGPVLDILRLSRNEGLISVGDKPGICMCSTQQFWTIDGGAHWHETTTLPEEFVKGAGRIYFWTASRLGTLATVPRETSSSHLASTTVATVGDGTIKAVDPIPGGVAALVSSRVHGQGWDTAPRILLVHGTTTQTVTLPTTRGRLLAESLQVAWPELTVTATDFVANPQRTTAWVSTDGGATWSTG
jgi:hypothetical protein